MSAAPPLLRLTERNRSVTGAVFSQQITEPIRDEIEYRGGAQSAWAVAGVIAVVVVVVFFWSLLFVCLLLTYLAPRSHRHSM